MSAKETGFAGAYFEQMLLLPCALGEFRWNPKQRPGAKGRDGGWASPGVVGTRLNAATGGVSFLGGTPLLVALKENQQEAIYCCYLFIYFGGRWPLQSDWFCYLA